LRVVLDTNVVVSALLFQGGRLAWLREAWQQGRIAPVVTRETTEELLRVLEYPKFRLTAEDREELLADYLPCAEVAVASASRDGLPACRDPDDDKFLLAAAAGRAEAPVTGDADLLALAEQVAFPILTPEALRERLGG
jgi:putative PIN family toxin of toxin-antitoxin system